MQGLIPDGDQERGDRFDYQMPRFLGTSEGQADNENPGDGEDKAEFTEERADSRKALITYIEDTYFPIISWEAGRDLKGSWQGPKGELAGT